MFCRVSVNYVIELFNNHFLFRQRKHFDLSLSLPKCLGCYHDNVVLSRKCGLSARKHPLVGLNARNTIPRSKPGVLSLIGALSRMTVLKSLTYFFFKFINWNPSQFLRLFCIYAKIVVLGGAFASLYQSVRLKSQGNTFRCGWLTILPVSWWVFACLRKKLSTLIKKVRPPSNMKAWIVTINIILVYITVTHAKQNDRFKGRFVNSFAYDIAQMSRPEVTLCDIAQHTNNNRSFFSK